MILLTVLFFEKKILLDNPDWPQICNRAPPPSAGIADAYYHRTFYDHLRMLPKVVYFTDWLGRWFNQ